METSQPSLPQCPPAPTQSTVRGWRIFQTTLSVAILLATLFTAWPLPALFSSDLDERFTLLLTPQPGDEAAPTSQRNLRIGIVSGHWGFDPGTVCSNGTTEAEVNLLITTLIQQKLTGQGFQVDLLQEFDARLEGYRAVVLVSIHNDSCEYQNDQATGFKVAASMGSLYPNRASRLTACLIDRYRRTTGLPFHPGSITEDMTDYHAFSEIDPNTTAAIIETGFLNMDYRILTEQPGLIADGVVAGILCYVNNESIEPTPMPTFGP